MYGAEAGPTDVTVQVHRFTGQAPEPNGLSVSFSFNCDCGHYLFFLVCLCHLYSLCSLRSCVCSPVRALSLSFDSFFTSISSAVLFSQHCVLLHSDYCAERVGPSSFSTYTDSFPPPPSPTSCSSPTSVPDRRATGYCTYVFSSEV